MLVYVVRLNRWLYFGNRYLALYGETCEHAFTMLGKRYWREVNA